MAPEERMQFADGLFARGLYKLAVDEYTKLLEAAPAFDRADAACYRLGDAYRHLGDSAQAQKEYAKVFKLYPKSEYAVRAGVKRADIFVSEKRYEDGVALYRMVLKRAPGEPVESACHYFIGDALLAVGKTNDAQRSYAALAEKFPGSEYNPFALLRLAEIGSARGEKPEKILRFYRSAATNSISERAAAEALYQIGRLEFKRNAFEDSSRAFAELANRYPQDKRTIESKLDAAWAQYSAGYTAKARALAEKGAESSDGLRSEWLYLQANCERALKKNRDAVRTYSTLIATGMGNRAAYIYERSLCYFELEEYSAVLKELADGSLADSKVVEDVLWLQGRASEELGQDDGAVQYYQKLLKEFPAGRFVEQASFRLAGILRARKDWKAAASQYYEVADKFPKSELAAKALLASGLCRMEAGQLNESAAAWTALVSDYAKSALVPEATLNLVAVKIRLKDFKAASRNLDLFLERFPQDKQTNEAWFWRGLIAAEQGRHKEAEQAFGKALELNIAGEMNAKSRAYRALAIYRSGDKKRAAAELQGLSGKEELEHAGRNIFLWLSNYRLGEKDAKGAEDAAFKLASLSVLPLEKQEAFCINGRAKRLAGKLEDAQKMYASAYEMSEASLFRAEAALALGEYSVESGKGEAEEFFKKAAELADGADGIAVRARAYMGLGTASEKDERHERAARYYMSVAVLFDDAKIVPHALEAAARCYGLAGMTAEADQARRELAHRYPKKDGDPSGD